MVRMPSISEQRSATGVRGMAVLWPLLATLALQPLATMAAYSLPAAAPAVARDLGVEGSLIGFFISTVYGVVQQSGGQIRLDSEVGVFTRSPSLPPISIRSYCSLGSVRRLYSLGIPGRWITERMVSWVEKCSFQFRHLYACKVSPL